MVTLPQRGDPASCSRLGGAMRTTAAALAAQGADLGTDAPAGPLTGALTRSLDHVGSALQVHAQELAECLAAFERLVDRAASAGLQVQGWKVVEPYGVARADDARRRLLAVPELQRQLDRVSGRLGRSRAQLERVAQRQGVELGAAARQARDR